jgi:hypothetical protein
VRTTVCAGWNIAVMSIPVCVPVPIVIPIPNASWPFGAMFQTTGTAAIQ